MREVTLNTLVFKKYCYNIFLFALIFIFLILPICFTKIGLFVCFFINFLYLITNLSKILTFFVGLKHHKYSSYFKKCKFNFDENSLPIYSILLPVRNEKDFVLDGLLESIYSLDYPKNKLDIKLIVDEDDISTLIVAKKLKNKYIFDLIVVPKSEISSKPLSCNYALNFAKGEFTTIYDAEDRPEKFQLKKVLKKFSESGSKTICVQCALNYYNKYDNFISYCFSIEYAMWFDFAIRGILKFATFFPLGGTSNHFKTEELIKIGRWDSYNVTEDAELGVRIAKAGYRISRANSITLEECPITTKRWIKQRTRWIKGFMQTFFEHFIFQKPLGVDSNVEFKPIRKIGFSNIIVFILFIFMSFFFFLSFVFVQFYQHRLSDSNKYLEILYILNFVSLIAQLYFSFIIIVFKNKMKFNFLYFIFFPFYWILHYFAGILSMIDLVKNPFYWSKTEHGISKIAYKKG